jgi:hypothetical protein
MLEVLIALANTISELPPSQANNGSSSSCLEGAAVMAASIASIGALIVLILQLKNQREQQKTQKLERFERTYFELLNSLQQHINLTKFMNEEGHEAYTRAYESTNCLLSDNPPPKAPLKNLQNEFLTIMKGEFKYYMKPFFYKFLKIVEHVLRARKPITKERKCLYISMVLDNITNAETGLLLFYFLTEKEESDDNSKCIFAKKYTYQRFFEDCNVFRYLNISKKWKRVLLEKNRDGKNTIKISKTAFKHPEINPQITREIYDDLPKRIRFLWRKHRFISPIHSWKYQEGSVKRAGE